MLFVMYCEVEILVFLASMFQMAEKKYAGSERQPNN